MLHISLGAHRGLRKKVRKSQIKGSQLQQTIAKTVVLQKKFVASDTDKGLLILKGHLKHSRKYIQEV